MYRMSCGEPEDGLGEIVGPPAQLCQIWLGSTSATSAVYLCRILTSSGHVFEPLLTHSRNNEVLFTALQAEAQIVERFMKQGVPRGFQEYKYLMESIRSMRSHVNIERFLQSAPRLPRLRLVRESPIVPANWVLYPSPTTT